MPAPQDDIIDLWNDSEAEEERILDQFEAAWQKGERPDVQDYLSQHRSAGNRLITALIEMDLEYRLKNSCDARVEDYLGICSLPPDDLIELIVREYEHRRRGDATVESSEYLIRFPELGDQLATRLHHVEGEQHDSPFSTRQVGRPMSDSAKVGETFQGSGCSDPDDLELMAGKAAVTGMLDHFELLEMIGEGSFGSVYRARDTSLDRVVALKIPRLGHILTDQQKDRFTREARHVAQLRHSGIIPVFEVGLSDNIPFIVCEYVEGRTLAELMTNAPLDQRNAAELILMIADALEHAHQSGVIHRDLKPSNIMIDSENRPRIMDFGLARKELDDITMTHDGDILGTPAYMSPEQASGSSHKADARSDIYAIGVILFEALTGERPFRGSSSMLLQRVINDEPPSARTLGGDISRDLDTICHKCLEKDPARRYNSAADLALDLGRFLRSEPIEARPIGRPERSWRWVKRNPKVATLSGLVIASLIIGTGVSWYFAAEATANFEDALAEKRQADLQLYAATINLAERDWQEGEVNRVLDRLRLASGELVGFEWHYLWRLCNSASVRIDLSEGKPASLALSPDGIMLAIVSRQANRPDSVSLWDSRTGRKIRHLIDHDGTIDSLSFSPDGTHLAVAGETDDELSELSVWAVATAELEFSCTGHDGGVCTVEFNPDGTRIASGGVDNTIRVWDARNGIPIHILKGHQYWVRDVVFDSSGRRLVSGSSDQTIKIWDLDTEKELNTLTGHTEAVFGVDIHEDRIASAGYDRLLKIWDSNSGKELKSISAGPHSTVQFSRDGTKVASAGSPMINVWDSNTGKTLQVFRGVNAGFSWSHDERRVIYGNMSGSVEIWNTMNAPAIIDLKNPTQKPVRGLAFDSQSQRLATASDDHTIRIWDLATGNELFKLSGHKHPIRSIAFHPQGRKLVAGGGTENGEGELILWDLATRDPIKLQGHGETVRTVAYNPDGTEIASGGGNHGQRGELLVWSSTKGKLINKLEEQSSAILSLAYSPDGQDLAIGSLGRHVSIWEVGSNQACRQLEGHESRVSDVAFSPTGDLLATASHDGTAIIWNSKDNKEPLMLPEHHGRVNALSFGPDGKRLATADGRFVRVWDTEIGQELLRLSLVEGHRIWSVSFSPNGERLAASNHFGDVRIWDARSPSLEVRIEREAVDLVDFLHTRHVLSSDVVHAIKNDKTIREEVREQALRYATLYHDNPLRLNERAWRIVKSRTSTSGQYRQALFWAQKASHLKPNVHFIVNTLGIAQCRNGHYEEAIATLTSADRMHVEVTGKHHPADLAFLAIAQFKDRRTTEARKTVELFEELFSVEKERVGDVSEFRNEMLSVATSSK